MANYVCNTIAVLETENCEIDINGDIVAKDGFEFLELYSKDKIIFSESEKKEVFEQKLTITNIFSNTTLLRLTKQHLIVKLIDINELEFVWGSLYPYNPVLVTITGNNVEKDLTFTRQSEYPLL